MLGLAAALSFRLRRAWEKTMSFAVKVIDHVEVFVGNLEVAAKWYQGVLGLTEITR
jgi:catechol-2,3-dioxygenase